MYSLAIAIDISDVMSDIDADNSSNRSRYEATGGYRSAIPHETVEHTATQLLKKLTSNTAPCAVKVLMQWIRATPNWNRFGVVRQ
ncbi:hypothetical protein ACHAPI_011593 [Fusarium lateritium]